MADPPLPRPTQGDYSRTCKVLRLMREAERLLAEAEQQARQDDPRGADVALGYGPIAREATDAKRACSRTIRAIERITRRVK